jgi:hypothetical protein
MLRALPLAFTRHGPPAISIAPLRAIRCLQKVIVPDQMPKPTRSRSGKRLELSSGNIGRSDDPGRNSSRREAHLGSRPKQIIRHVQARVISNP